MKLEFQFPEVARAYTPRTTIAPGAAAAMVLAGGSVAVLGGLLLGIGVRSFWDAGGQVVRLLFVLFLPAALGLGISAAVDLTGRATNNHNRTLSLGIRLASGVAAFAVLFLFSRDPVLPEPVFGPLAGVAMFIALVAVAGGASMFDASDPFCDEHNTFMTPRYLLIAGSAEREAFDSLARRDFAGLRSLPSAGSGPGQVTVTIWYCPVCSNGYIEMTTKQTAEADGGASMERSRLVHSSALSKSEVEVVSH